MQGEREDNSCAGEDWVDSALPENIKDFRRKLRSYKRPEHDKYGDGLLADAYIAARECPTGALGKIAQKMGMDRFTLEYYMNTYPDFTLAVRVGQLDGRNDMIVDVEGALLSRALGMEYEESRVEESEVLGDGGEFKKVAKKTITTKKVLPPDSSAALEILRKVDPSWNPKSTVQFQVADQLDVVEDVNINIDYRNLSPSTLRELIVSQRTTDKNTQYTLIDGGVNSDINVSEEKLEENRNKNRESCKKAADKKKAQNSQAFGKDVVSRRLLSSEDREAMVQKSRRPMSEETKLKISEAMKNRKR